MGGVKFLYKIMMKMPDGVPLPDGYDIVRCGICGSCYADTPASAKDIDKYYAEHNIYGGWNLNSSSNRDYEVISRSLKGIVGKDSFIVDIGCGNGGLLKFLKNEGFTKLYGLDPSTEAIRCLHEYGIEGSVGLIYDIPDYPLDKADVVIFTMVLEHLLEPERAITAIKKNYLKENGIIVVTWPYFEDLIADNTPVINNFNHEHINYFSNNSVNWLFGRCGFRLKDHHLSLNYSIDEYILFSNVSLFETDSAITSEEYEYVDNKTELSIREYTNRMHDVESPLIEKISRLRQDKSEVAVWGTGSYFMHLMSVSDLSCCNIKFLVDNNVQKQGRKLYGIDVVGCDRIKGFSGTVLITSMLYSESIAKQIREMGNKSCKILRL